MQDPKIVPFDRVHNYYQDSGYTNQYPTNYAYDIPYNNNNTPNLMGENHFRTTYQTHYNDP